MTDSTSPDPQLRSNDAGQGLYSAGAGRSSSPPRFDSAAASPVEQPPIVPRELMALVLIIVLCDLTIYRGRGYTGYSALFAVAPLLLFIGMVRREFNASCWIMGPLLALTSIRLVWCGSIMAIAAGFVVLCGLAMSLAGLRPYVLQSVVFAAQLVSAGHRGLHHYSRSLGRFTPTIRLASWFAVVLPLVTLLAFGTIFVMANPDLVKSFSSWLDQIVQALQRWLEHVEALEIAFWIGVGWIGVGLLRPDRRQVAAPDNAVHLSVDKSNAPLYEAFRNTLVMVIGLFAVYLVFEFQTLWFRVFPKGFHYSGYAHQGAAWLTVALGMATLMLSVIFRGRILDDPRLGRLRVLSWIWSVENLLLAISVFNRLFIYVGFNGMTQMRVVGFLGVASVVGGFLLVLRKISQNYEFVWLIRRQLWTVTFAAYLYAILPVDAFVNEYNVRRILAGDPAPSVQISVHPTSAEGYLRLPPLLQCQDPIIRQGIRAMLAQKLSDAEIQSNARRQLGWTAFQLAKDRLLQQLRSASSQWQNETSTNWQAMALAEFHRYAYQWY